MPTGISGINMLVAVDGTAVVAQSNATLTSSSELAEAVDKNTNFVPKNSGDQDWNLSYEGQVTDDTGKHALTNGNAGLDVKVDATDDATENPVFETVPGLQSLTLSMEQELQETAPGIDKDPNFVNRKPLRRDWTVDAEGHYYDPADEAIYQAIHDARDAGNNLDSELTVMGLTFAGSIAADEMEIGAGSDENASYSLSFGGSGSLTKSGSAESTISSLLDLYFNQSTATAYLRHEDDSGVVTGSTAWNGSAYISSLEIELSRNEHPSLSAEFAGDGALSRTTQ